MGLQDSSWLQWVLVAIGGAIWWEIRSMRKRLHDIEDWKAAQVLLLEHVREHLLKGKQ
jgi:hypothetical protein